MPRTGRKKSESGIYHIVLRGINRQTIFEDEEDREKFIQTINRFKKESGYKIYAYCLMGNHIHLLIKEEKEGLGIIMRRIGASYVYWYNAKYERSGHLFQDRYKSEIVEDEKYLLTVVRYIHQNPLKAGIVQNIKDYKWSSYCDYIDKDTEDKNKIVETDFILDMINNDRKKAIKTFREYHEKNSNIQCLDINEKRRIKDSEAIEIIKRICNVPHCKDLQKLDVSERNSYIKILKENELSTRQISRLTGISRHIVLKS